MHLSIFYIASVESSLRVLVAR